MDFAPAPLPQENLGPVYDKALEGLGSWMPIELVKTCKKCGEVKGLEEFGKHSVSPDGKRKVCFDCRHLEWVMNPVSHRKPQTIQKEKEVRELALLGLKRCSRCGEEVPLSEFYRDKRKRCGSGVQSECKKCHNQDSRKYTIKNKEKLSLWRSDYWEQNQDQIRLHKKEKHAPNLVTKRLWEDKNRERNNKKRRERYANDPLYRFACCARARVHAYLKGKSKSKTTEQILSCTFEEAWNLLIPRLRFPMTKENYGKVWHVDHIRPICSFDLSDPEQVKACFHYTNLQPLFVEENRKKGGRY